MTKKTKNIPLTALCCKTEKLFAPETAANKKFKTFDIAPEWIPAPDNIQVSIQRYTAGKDFSPGMFHNRFVLKLHLEGLSRGWVDNCFHTFLPGEGILIFPFQFHCLTGTSEPEGQLRLLINFTLETEDQVKLEKLRNCIFKFDDEIKNMLSELLQKLPDNATGNDHDIYLLIISILRKISALTVSGGVPAPARNAEFEKIFAYITGNYRNDPRISDISRLFGYSETGLNKLFRRECSRTPGSIIRELRLRDAANMLRMTKLTVSEISRICGFSNAFVFSRAFRKYFGRPPKEYRE